MENQPLRGAMAVSASGDRLLLDSATEPPSGPFAPENAEPASPRGPCRHLYYSEPATWARRSPPSSSR